MESPARACQVPSVLVGVMHVHPWPSDPSIAHFVVADSPGTVDATDIARRIDAARAAAATAVRTGALFPATAAVFASMGFVVIDTLSLLRLGLTGDSYRNERRQALQTVRRHGGRLARLPARRYARAAVVDQAAFGSEWGNSAESLRRVRLATPQHRARQIGEHGDMVAFAITGLGRGHGYLQRLAVTPGARRHGYGRALVLDSLTWMQTRGATTAVVNTGSGNTAALDLYHSVGFRDDDILQVMELRLDP